MSLELAITENTNAIRDLIAALGNGQHVTQAQVAAVVKEAKPKAEKKQETAKPEAASTPTTVEPAAAPEPKAENSAQAATYNDAADAVTKLARTKGRDAAIAVLSKFGAAKLPDVKPEDFAAVIAAAVEAGA
jgi:membrane-bound ClpP family serine protease